MKNENKKAICIRIISILMVFALVFGGSYYMVSNTVTVKEDAQDILIADGIETELAQLKELADSLSDGSDRLLSSRITNCSVSKTKKGEMISYDFKTGKGKMKINGYGTYNGYFSEDGLRDGSGTFTWENGDKYSGNWSNDKISGKGKLTFSDKSVLEGTFKKSSIYDGKYTRNSRGGKITYIITKGKVSNVKFKTKKGTSYSGKFKNSMFNGQCTVKYYNGDRYTGNLTNNKKSGTGKYTWKNGAYYNGNWKSDKMSGTGTYYYTSDKSGRRVTGTFKSNKPNGKCTYYSSSNKKYTTTWSGGKCTKVAKA